MEWSGLAETAYRSGIKELIEKGFLVNTSGNHYIFLEDRNILIDFNNHKKNIAVDNKDIVDEFDF